MAHHVGSLVRERDGQDPIGRESILHQAGDAGGEYTRLAGAGPCEHEQGAFPVLNGRMLLRVEGDLQSALLSTTGNSMRKLAPESECSSIIVPSCIS
jgi:hypothetical protein